MEESSKKFLSLGNLSILLSNKWTLVLILLGVILIGFGALYFKNGVSLNPTHVEVLNSSTEGQDGEIIVEIVGQVVNPGVYKLPNGSRVEDLLVLSGGISVNADRLWMDKYLNRASKLTDGQKVYVPSTNEQTLGASAKESGEDQTVSSNFSSDSNSLININTASLSELDKLPGIGPVYGQSIIDHRPYSTTEELVSKGAIKDSVYQKIKSEVSVY